MRRISPSTVSRREDYDVSVAGHRAAAASGATAAIGGRQVLQHPGLDAVGEGSCLRLGLRQSTVELRNAGTLVEQRLPVGGVPKVRRPQ